MNLEESPVGDNALGKKYCSDKTIVDFLEERFIAYKVCEQYAELDFDLTGKQKNTNFFRKAITCTIREKL